MLRPRAIPVLLLRAGGLVKTRRFGSPVYVGDPRNAVRIFNEKEVDELVVLDIAATAEGRDPDFGLIQEIVSEAFMPVAYGGGIASVDHARRVLADGVEKIVLGTAAVERPQLVREIAEIAGSQSVVVCIDVRRRLFGGREVCTRNAKRATGLDPVEFARTMEAAGAGELIVQSIDRDGQMTGYDLELIRDITTRVNMPVVALGGAANLADLGRAVIEGGASAAAAGSLFVFHGRYRAVLINYPTPQQLTGLWP
jgi:cyclase